jgi:hypothetical protein
MADHITFKEKVITKMFLGPNIAKISYLLNLGIEPSLPNERGELHV